MSDEEMIVVKPSTELIPDEYEHAAEKIMVHVFFLEEYVKKVDSFVGTLEAKGYSIPKENKHDLDKDNYYGVIEDIKEQTKDASGLLILFCGRSGNAGELRIVNGSNTECIDIQKIWLQFNSYNCKELKNKPKLFIFEIKHSVAISTDTGTALATFATPYETPSEADMLIVYNKFETDDSYIDQFTENINNYGEEEDIVTLASFVTSTDFRPVIISTLTRKFFFTSNSFRHHYAKIYKHSDDVTKILEDIKTNLDDKSKKKPKKKVFSFSFRNKNKATSKDNNDGSEAITKIPEEKKKSIGSSNNSLNLGRRQSRGKINVEQKPRFRLV